MINLQNSYELAKSICKTIKMATVRLETLEIVLIGMKCDVEEEREVVTSVPHSLPVNHHLGSAPICSEEPASLL